MNRNTERIEYSSQLATMYVENMQLLTMFCKENYALTASEYELLLVLLEAQSRLRVQQLADFLVLKPSTIWQMALALEDRGLVSKTNDEDDRRLLCLSLSKQGEHLIRECNQRLTGIHEDVTYDSLPNIEHTQYLHSTIGESLDLLRGHSTDVTIPELPPTEFRVEFMVFMRVIIEQWKECIRSYVNRPDFTGGSKFEKMEPLWKKEKDIPKKSATKQSGWSMNTNLNTRPNGLVSCPLLKSSV